MVVRNPHHVRTLNVHGAFMGILHARIPREFLHHMDVNDGGGVEHWWDNGDEEVS